MYSTFVIGTESTIKRIINLADFPLVLEDELIEVFLVTAFSRQQNSFSLYLTILISERLAIVFILTADFTILIFVSST